MSGAVPAARSAIIWVSYCVASYSLSSTVMSGFASWKASARTWNSGVVARLQPARVMVIGSPPAASVAAPSEVAPPVASPDPPSEDPPLQAVRTSVSAARLAAPVRILRFIAYFLSFEKDVPGGPGRWWCD